MKLADLSRLTGVSGIRTRLYYDAGIDTLDKFSDWEAAKLREMLIGFIERTEFEGIAPLPKEIVATITQTMILRRMVRY